MAWDVMLSLQSFVMQSFKYLSLQGIIFLPDAIP